MEFKGRNRLSCYGFKSLMPYENLGKLSKTELLTIFLTKLNKPRVKIASGNSYSLTRPWETTAFNDDKFLIEIH